MSISTFQEKFIKGGCGVAVLIVCAAVMFGGMFYTCALSSSGENPDHSEAKAALSVAGNPIPANIIAEAINGQTRQMMQFEEIFTPQFEATTYARVIGGLIDEASMLPLAQKNGVDLSDANLLKAAEYQLEQQLVEQRERATLGGQLKAGATDKDWEDYIKKESGMTIAEIKKGRLDAVRKALAENRQNAVMSLARPALEMHLAAKNPMTDDELKRAYELISYKRIFIGDSAAPKPAAERADTALKAIQGGLKFEAAMDRYTNDPVPPGGKKLSETTQTVTGDAAASDAQFRALVDLKAGQTSGVVDVPGGKAIYKVISRTPNLPKDFEQKKETYRRQQVANRVRAEIDKQLAALKASGDLVSFSSPGYKAIWAYQQASTEAMTNPEKMRPVYEQAKQAVAKNEGYDARAAALAQYAALDALYNAPGADKAKLRKDRIDAINSILASSESFKLRMELVDLYVAEKQNDDAVDQLLTAAMNNSSTEEQGLKRFQEVGLKVTELKKAGVLNAEKEKEILAEQDRWRKEKAEADKIEAERKKQEEEDRKKAEAEAKKAEAEAKKNAPSAKPTTGSTTSGSTATPPATTAGRP